MVKVRKQLARAMCLLLALQTASCSNSTKTESSSSLASGDPSLQSETTESLADTSSGTDTEMSLPSVCPNCEQSETENVEQDFNLTFCDGLQVFDYGKETVNVYRAEYDDYIQLSDSFFTEWFTHPGEFELLTKWATGRPFSYSPEIRSVDDFYKYDGIPTETRSFQCKDGVTVKRNIQNVEMVALKDIEDAVEIINEIMGDASRKPAVLFRTALEEAGISDGTITSARKKLGITSKRMDGHWSWINPKCSINQ